MKNLTYLLAAVLLSVTLIIACKKEGREQPLQLIAKKTTIKLLETDSLILLGADGDSVKWSVTPSGLMFHNSNKATVLFYQPGTYTVTAKDPGHAPLSKTITVLNESYYPPVTDNPPPPPAQHDTTTIIPVAGDLTITPKIWKLPNTDSLDVILTINSVNTYPCGNSSFNLKQSQFNNNFAINIPNVLQPGPTTCAKPNQPIKAIVEFFPQVNTPVVVGTSYPLTIKVADTTYTGSIVYGHNYVDITWPHTSGVTFTITHVTL